MKGFNGKISVIIPAHNEAVHIYNNLKETIEVFDKAGCNYEIVVVNDGSTDNTYEEARRIEMEYSYVKVINHDTNHGKGNALKEGFNYVSGDIVVFLDADLDLHPNQIHTLFRIMNDTEGDVVIGSKRHPQSRLNYPFTRKIISNIYAFILWIMFRLPLKDTQTGLKIYKYKVLKDIFPKVLCKRFAFDVELLANAYRLGYKIVEAPIVLNFRRGIKWGRIRLIDFYRTGMDTLAVFYRMHILKYYDRNILLPSDFPKVSILIPAKDNKGYIIECLAHCKELDYPSYEIIFLPDEICTVGFDDIKIIPTGKVGPSIKRDIGLKHATGEIIAFLDDDTYPTKEWLKKAIRNFGEDEIAAVGGPAITPESDGFMQKASGYVYSSWFVGGGYAYRYKPMSHRDVEDFPSCNLIIRKSVIEAVGGFDNRFWPGEDTIICMKITKHLKKKIVYDPEAIVYHHRRRLFIPHLKQIKNYAEHRGYFVKRFPETSFKLSYFIPSIFVLIVVFGWLLIPLNNFFKNGYFGVIILYLLLAILTSIKQKDIKTVIAIFTGIISTHFIYGICFIKGLLSKRMAEE